MFEEYSQVQIDELQQYAEEWETIQLAIETITANIKLVTSSDLEELVSLLLTEVALRSDRYIEEDNHDW